MNSHPTQEHQKLNSTENWHGLVWESMQGQDKNRGSGSLNSIDSEQAGMLLHTQELLWIQATGNESAAPCSKAEITSSCSNPIEKPIQERVSLIL